MVAAAALVGQTFNRLTVVERAGSNKNGSALWLCRCSCGGATTLRTVELTKGHTKSCGCLAKETSRALCLKRNPSRVSHGMTGTSEYQIWKNILARCRNANAPNHHNYGGRGITVCGRWLESFENFYADMGDRPSKQHTLDRIDNNGPYSPENCRWAIWEVQHRNKRTNRLLTADGVTKHITDWANDLGICIKSLHWRIENWGLEAALTTPKHVRRA